VLLKEQISEREYKDGRAFRRLREDEDIMPALERLLRRLDDDLIQGWTDDETGQKTKKWLKGARESLRAVIPAMDEMVRNAEDVIAERKELEETARSKADDGLGSGDLAIA
jgi:hypothetical protein